MLKTLMFIATLALIAAQATAAEPQNPMILGPAVGETLPAFEAIDTGGRRRTFESLRGPNGLVLVLFRSVDW